MAKRKKKSKRERIRDAAQELLAACKAALVRLERLGAEDDKENVGPCPTCEALRAAIKKAGG